MVEQSRAKVSSYAIRGWGLSRRFLLCESCFQPRDVFQEALVVFEHALAGQDEEIIAELLITLKVDFKQPFISYGQDLAVFYAFDRSGSSVIGRKKAKFSHVTSWRKLDADFLDQELSCDGEKHFGSRITLPEQSVAPAISAFAHERFEPFHRHVTLRRVACLLNELEQLAEANGIDRQQQQIKQKGRDASGKRAGDCEECTADHIRDPQRNHSLHQQG